MAARQTGSAGVRWFGRGRFASADGRTVSDSPRQVVPRR